MPRNRLYFARRAEQSRTARAAAKDPGARLAHDQLLSAYNLLAKLPLQVETSVRAGAAVLPMTESEDRLTRWDNDGGTAQ